MSVNQEVFKIDKKLQVREELLGLHAINPFNISNSSSRNVMLTGHLSQTVTLDNGDEKIIQTGLEKQLGQATFSVSLPNDALILDVVRKYSGVDANTADEEVGYLVMFKNLDTNEIDCIELPPYHKLDPQFGFKYNYTDNFHNLMKNTIMEKDTILADSPAVSKNSGYKFGVNANMALMSLPAVDEDAVVISESLANRLTHKVYITRVVEFGEDKFPLNLYGDEDNYKAFPNIGESINETGIIMALRDYDSSLSPATTSVNDVRDYNPIFDECTYASGPGGKVVDIKAYKFNSRKDTYTGTAHGIMKYVNGLKKYYNDIINSYNVCRREHPDTLVSPRLHRILMDAYALTNGEHDKLKFTYRKERINMYRIEFTIEYTRKAVVGTKISGLAGGKGVVSAILPDKDMPVYEDGSVRADIIMDPLSINSRMNNGRLYEEFFNGVSRVVKQIILNETLDKGKPINDLTHEEVDNLWVHVLNVLKIIGNEQYDAYKLAGYKDKYEILNEIVNEEFYIYYRVSDRPPYLIVNDFKGTIYEPKPQRVIFKSPNVDKVFTSDEPVMIAPEYVIVLNKTAENFLSTASAKVNHHGLPISDSSKNKVKLPWRNTPVRTLSETDTRIYGSYVGRLGLIELKDRANSIETHREVYKNILYADNPAVMKHTIDRNLFPYGGDAALKIAESVLSVNGAEMVFVKDKHRIHPVVNKKG